MSLHGYVLDFKHLQPLKWLEGTFYHTFCVQSAYIMYKFNLLSLKHENT